MTEQEKTENDPVEEQTQETQEDVAEEKESVETENTPDDPEPEKEDGVKEVPIEEHPEGDPPKEDEKPAEVIPQQPHPIDVMDEVLHEINRQKTRLKSKNAGTLKYELVNNIYPLMEVAIRANMNILVDMAEAEENAINEEMAESIGRMIDVCEKIMMLYETVEKKLEGEDKEIWEEIVDFAAEVTEKAEKLEN